MGRTSKLKDNMTIVLHARISWQNDVSGYKFGTTSKQKAQTEIRHDLSTLKTKQFRESTITWQTELSKTRGDREYLPKFRLQEGRRYSFSLIGLIQYVWLSCIRFLYELIFLWQEYDTRRHDLKDETRTESMQMSITASSEREDDDVVSSKGAWIKLWVKEDSLSEKKEKRRK